MRYLNYLAKASSISLDEIRLFRQLTTFDGFFGRGAVVDHKKLAKLRQLITEGLRVQLGNEGITYINVGHAMEDISSRQNHSVFARRGCGKTLLLHDSAKQLPDEIKAIYLNCEDFKQHTFPNVLIEILSSLFAEVDSQLSGWFGRKARTKQIIGDIRAKLKTMHRAPDTHDEEVKQKTADEEGSSAAMGVQVEALKFSLDGSKKTKSETERSFKSHRQKLQELDLWLPELKKSLREFFAVSAKVKCIFLQIDDLYHLKRADQAFVVDYIHRLCKDVPLFLQDCDHATCVNYVCRSRRPADRGARTA